MLLDYNDVLRTIGPGLVNVFCLLFLDLESSSS